MSSGNPRMLVIILAATGVMVAAIAALALDSWLLLGVLLVLHGITTAVVVGYTFKRAKQSEDKPDPVAEARIEDERAGS
jgi:membrane protein implicated in regulation of membrane protease activity